MILSSQSNRLHSNYRTCLYAKIYKYDSIYSYNQQIDIIFGILQYYMLSQNICYWNPIIWNCSLMLNFNIRRIKEFRMYKWVSKSFLKANNSVICNCQQSLCQYEKSFYIGNYLSNIILTTVPIWSLLSLNTYPLSDIRLYKFQINRLSFLQPCQSRKYFAR